MGSYGIGLARIAATAVEQNHDADGIVWPASVTPFHVQLILIKPGDDVQRELAERLYEELSAVRLPGASGGGEGPQGLLEILFDDRELSPGVKFKDADLVGCPVQVIVGKRAPQDIVEMKLRGSRERSDIGADAAAERIRGVLSEMLAALT